MYAVHYTGNLPSRESELVGVDTFPEAPCGEHQERLPLALTVPVVLRKNADVDWNILVTETHGLRGTGSGRGGTVSVRQG